MATSPSIFRSFTTDSALTPKPSMVFAASWVPARSQSVSSAYLLISPSIFAALDSLPTRTLKAVAVFSASMPSRVTTPRPAVMATIGLVKNSAPGRVRKASPSPRRAREVSPAALSTERSLPWTASSRLTA